MSLHEDALRLRHMLDHAKEAVALAQGKRQDDIEGYRVLCLALLKLLEIVGEAAGRVTSERQLQHIPAECEYC